MRLPLIITPIRPMSRQSPIRPRPNARPPGQTRAREIRVPPIRVARIPVGRATTPVQRTRVRQTPAARTRAGQGTIRVQPIHVPQARVVPIPVGRAITRAQQHPVRQIRVRPIIPAERQTPVRQARAVHVPPIRVLPITHVLPRRVRRPVIPVLRPTLVPHTIRAVLRTRVRRSDRIQIRAAGGSVRARSSF